MSQTRKPAAFRLDPPMTREPREPAPRRPRAVAAPEVIVDAVDAFDAMEDVLDAPPPATAPKRRSWAARLFLGAFGVLASLALGLWTDRLIRDLFSRADWLGWAAAATAALAALALAVILLREFAALRRLTSAERLRARALDAVARDDPKAARHVAAELSALVADKPETAAGRRALRAIENEVVDGADIVRLAEAEILAPLDRQARTLILDAAKRVSVVTAVSPRALVDIAYVLFEAGRLVRRLSELYGGRPGTLGFFRLARAVLAHLAVTGAIAAGDEFVHQIVGQGLAARLSAKLGEGVVNGMMTARIGVAAMEVTRPLPFVAAKRPGMGDFLAALTSFTRAKADG